MGRDIAFIYKMEKAKQVELKKEPGQLHPFRLPMDLWRAIFFAGDWWNMQLRDEMPVKIDKLK